MIWLLEQAKDGERAKIQNLVRNWEPRHFPRLLKLLQSHESLNESCRAVHQYLHAARQSLDVLPESESRISLFRLTDYLAQQTDALRSST
jgi:geranylgeranyl pyrophosphate synthase